MRPFGIKKACIGELGQRLAAPQAEGLAQRRRRRLHLAVGGQPPSHRDQLLGAADVEPAGARRARGGGPPPRAPAPPPPPPRPPSRCPIATSCSKRTTSTSPGPAAR